MEKRKAAYLEDGWSAVEDVPTHSHFSTGEHEKAPKRKGGRVYIAVNNRGEVTFHEGYVTQKEGQLLRTEADGNDVVAVLHMMRRELTSTLIDDVDLLHHTAVRGDVSTHPSVAPRLLVVHHTVAASPWWVAVQHKRTS